VTGRLLAGSLPLQQEVLNEAQARLRLLLEKEVPSTPDDLQARTRDEPVQAFAARWRQPAICLSPKHKRRMGDVSGA
jgi:hypothetical protein